MKFNRKLCKAFAAVAIVAGCLGAVAPPAHANGAVVIMMTANNNTQRHAQLDEDAKNAALVDPSPENIQRLFDRNITNTATAPFAVEAVREMNIPAGTKAEDITQAQRDTFARLLHEKGLVSQMSAGTKAEAEARGVSQGLSKYFEAAKAELGYSGPVTLAQAQQISDSIHQQHWEHDTKPALQIAGVVIGGGVLAAAGATYLRERNYYS